MCPNNGLQCGIKKKIGNISLCFNGAIVKLYHQLKKKSLKVSHMRVWIGCYLLCNKRGEYIWFKQNQINMLPVREEETQLLENWVHLALWFWFWIHSYISHNLKS